MWGYICPVPTHFNAFVLQRSLLWSQKTHRSSCLPPPPRTATIVRQELKSEASRHAYGVNSIWEWLLKSFRKSLLDETSVVTSTGFVHAPLNWCQFPPLFRCKFRPNAFWKGLNWSMEWTKELWSLFAFNNHPWVFYELLPKDNCLIVKC